MSLVRDVGQNLSYAAPRKRQVQVLREESRLSTACWCVEQTAGAQRRAGWALAADELTPGSERAGLRPRSVVSV